MPVNYGPAILGLTVSILMAVLALFFRAGALVARVDELERWRGTIRTDMHEISEQIETLMKQVANVASLIDERTNRRSAQREGPG